MKREWDLLRSQLVAIENEEDLFADIPPRLEQGNMLWDEFRILEQEQKKIEHRILQHYMMLIDEEYVMDLHVVRGVDLIYSTGNSGARLTKKGHDLLDSMRSSKVWESIKSTATSKGIDLSFEAIKSLGAIAFKQFSAQ